MQRGKQPPSRSQISLATIPSSCLPSCGGYGRASSRLRGRRLTGARMAPLAMRHQVAACLGHKSWEARVSAGEAIGLLAEAFPHHSVQDLESHCAAAGRGDDDGAAAGAAAEPQSGGGLMFQEFDLQRILEKGSALLASGGQVQPFPSDPALRGGALSSSAASKRSLESALAVHELPLTPG